MWGLLWLVPLLLLAWAVLLVVRKVKKETAAEEDETPKTLEHRLAALDDDLGKPVGGP